MTYSLKFRYVTPEELAERKNDTAWHETHWFMDGYGYMRNSDGAKIMGSDLSKRQIPFSAFPKLPVQEQDKIAAEIKVEDEYRATYMRLHPPEPITFDNIKMPIFKNKFPNTLIDDLVGVRPIIRE